MLRYQNGTLTRTLPALDVILSEKCPSYSSEVLKSLPETGELVNRAVVFQSSLDITVMPSRP